MKSFSFSTTSIHWRLASVYGPVYENRPSMYPQDICSYGRAVLKGMMIVAVITAMSGVVAAFVALTSAWIAVMIAMGMWVTPDELAFVVPIFAVVIGIFALGGYGLHLNDKYQEHRDATRTHDEPESAWKVWYRSFKEKTCVRVEFVDPDA